MKKIKKILPLIICIFIFLSLFVKVKADSSELYLNTLDFSVQVNSDGSMDVVETWDIDIEETNTLFKTFKKDTTKYTSIIGGKVSKIDSSGTEVPLKSASKYYYHVPTNYYYFLNQGNTYEVAWGTGYENSSGRAKYKISYRVENVVAVYDDCAELYWQFIGSDFEIPAKKITGTIKLPKEVANKEEIRVWGHTPDLNGTIYSTNNSTVEFEVNKNTAKKMVEVRIAMPTDLITESERKVSANKLDDIIKEETGWATTANNKRTTKLTVIIAIYVIIFVILMFFLIKNIRMLRSIKKVEPTVHHEYFRDLPREDATPAEAEYILENKYNGFDVADIGKVFSATILNLALKKAIKIEQIVGKKQDSKIKIITNDISQITEQKDELIIFEFIAEACRNKKNGIFNNKNVETDDKSITMQELKKYIQSNNSKVVTLKNKLDKQIKAKLTQNNYLDLEGIKKKGSFAANSVLSVIIMICLYVFADNKQLIVSAANTIGMHWIGILGMIVFAIVDIVIGSSAKNKISAYTQKGVDEQDKWKALKKYMEDFSLLKEKKVPDLVLWEKFLVYATAFGIAEKVIKQLKITYPEYDTLDYAVYPNMYIFMHTDFSKSFNSISSSMSSSFSSGTGGGGGFSVGGGRRRWPAVVEEVDKIYLQNLTKKY